VARGNNKQVIFDAELRSFFIRVAAHIANREGWLVFAWALMANHFHIVLQTPTGNLSNGMHDLNQRFAQESNARFGRINHCFGRRFWDAHLETDGHLLESVRYAMWNPARVGLGTHPRESRWTSFRESAGLDHPSGLLAHRELVEHFGSNATRARAAFSRFVSDGRVRCQEPWQDRDGSVT
jgi:REP element-mobilizing transposase RayT